MKSIYLNEVTFGNPTQQQLKIINTPNYLEDILELDSFPPPNNDSIVTLQELNIITEGIEKISMPHNLTHLEKFTEINSNLQHNIINHFKETFDLDFTDLVNNISNDLEPLILKLKYYYNRARPTQLASILKLKLAPLNNSETPSYPCSHTLITNVIMEVIVFKDPKLEEVSKIIKQTVEDSRVLLGQNYPSDNDFSFEIAQKIVEQENFKLKYNLIDTKINDE